VHSLNHPIGCFARTRSVGSVRDVAKTIRVALENDYVLVLEGLRTLLQSASDIRVVELDVQNPPRRRVDVTLLDTYGTEDLEHRLRELVADPDTGALVVFSFSDEPRLVRRVLKAGAKGFISKALSGAQIIDGLRAAARGERIVLHRQSQRAALDERLRWPGDYIGLTERESELLALLPSGMTNQELAAQLYVSENTIKTQLRHLYTKLGVHNRTQAATLADRDLLETR
jgi:two-component system, NarL family, response regulator LiaR